MTALLDTYPPTPSSPRSLMKSKPMGEIALVMFRGGELVPVSSIHTSFVLSSYIPRSSTENRAGRYRLTASLLYLVENVVSNRFEIGIQPALLTVPDVHAESTPKSSNEDYVAA